MRKWYVNHVFIHSHWSTDANYLCAQLEDPDNFEIWEKLVRAAETLEGGLNRNSSPQAIATTRDSYDRFLAKFPLLFGYWKKYADLEFSIAGTEAAEMVSRDPLLACVRAIEQLLIISK